MAPSKRRSGYGETHIKRHKISEWETYEVKKEELDSLSKGTPGDITLNFAIAAISSAVSFFIAWLSLEYEESPKLYGSYLIISISLTLVSVFLFYLWKTNHENRKSIIKEIQERSSDED